MLVCINASSLSEAIALINAGSYGNGAAIFTDSAAAARRSTADVECGMVGVNAAIPVPLPFGYSFTGWRDSFRGDVSMYGRDGVRFYTRVKTVTGRYGEAEEKLPGIAGVGVQVPPPRG